MILVADELLATTSNLGALAHGTNEISRQLGKQHQPAGGRGRAEFGTLVPQAEQFELTNKNDRAVDAAMKRVATELLRLDRKNSTSPLLSHRRC